VRPFGASEVAAASRSLATIFERTGVLADEIAAKAKGPAE
jgi:hypothetical protein